MTNEREKKPLRLKRDMCFFLGPTFIEPKSRQLVEFQAGCLFHVDRIINSGDSAGLIINSVFVNGKAQHRDLWKLPLSDFIGEVVKKKEGWDICYPASILQFVIENVDSVRHTFIFDLLVTVFINP